MLDIIIKWAIPFILTTICSYIIKELKETRKYNQTMQKSMIILLRSSIIGECEDYLAKGYLPEYARICLEEQFDQYTFLGGNHGVKILIEKTYNLPSKIKKED